MIAIPRPSTLRLALIAIILRRSPYSNRLAIRTAFPYFLLLLVLLSLGCTSTLRTAPFCRDIPSTSPPRCCPVIPPTSTFESKSPLNWEPDSTFPSRPFLPDTWKTTNPPVLDLPAVDTRSPALGAAPSGICNAVPLLQLHFAPGSTTRYITPLHTF